MRYDDTNTELLFLNYKEWCLERGLPVDETVFEKLGTYVYERGGYEPALSLWDRAAIELGVKLTPRAKPTPIPLNFQDQLNALTSGQLRTKITPPVNAARADQHDLRADRVRDHVAGGYDPQFADWFNRWSSGERPEGYAENEQPQLTAAGWRGLPPHVAAIKMRDRDFRAQVQRLVDRGEI